MPLLQSLSPWACKQGIKYKAGAINRLAIKCTKKEELLPCQINGITFHCINKLQDNFSEYRLKMYTMYGQSCNIEKFLVASLKIVAVNPCVKMFDLVMKDYIRYKGVIYAIVP